VQSGKTYIAPHKSLFQRIVSLLRSIFFNPTVSVEVLFDRLYKGDLTRYTPSKNNIMFKKLNLGITNFDGLEIFNNRLSLTAVNTIDKLIYDYLTNNNTPLNRVFHEPNLLNNAYNYAYSQVASKYSSILDMYKDQIANGADIEKVTNAFTNSNNLFSTLIKHFPEVVKYHKDNSKVFLISDACYTFYI
jgi:hypothetical protein